VSGIAASLTAKVLCVAFCLCIVSVSGCGPSQADLESSMPSPDEIELSAEEDAAMTAGNVGGEPEVDGSTDTF